MRKTVIKRLCDTNLTISEATTSFINDKKSLGITRASLDNYANTFYIFKKDLNLDDSGSLKCITKNLINSWINVLQDRNCSTSSINHYLVDIRAFCNWCFKHNYLSSFDINKLKGQESKLKYYTDDDLKKLILKPKADCSFVQSRTYAIVCFILATGARASTICNLKIEDIDFKANEINYTHLKNKKFAIVPMSVSLNKVLTEYLDTWKRHDATWLFPDCAEGQLTVRALRQALNRYCKERGVPGYGPHALRHSFARGWVVNNGDMLTLQHMLTHADLQMTRKYINLFSNDYKKDYELFSPLDKMLMKKRDYISKSARAVLEVNYGYSSIY